MEVFRVFILDNANAGWLTSEKVLPEGNPLSPGRRTIDLRVSVLGRDSLPTLPLTTKEKNAGYIQFYFRYIF